MKLQKIVGWLDGVLKPERFDDVSNNGVQIARRGDEVKKVAFAVDGSAKSVKAAAEQGAQLLVVHHGISWGGGIKRITEGAYNVVRAAMDANLALYASHLPLDANKTCGNNWEIARSLGLTRVTPAFNYHGNVIGVVGYDATGRKIGVCSGGAGAFAPEAKALGCDLYITGEADWGEVIAAENVGMAMECHGHYETETFGVKALMREMKRHLKVATTFVAVAVCLGVGAGEGEKTASVQQQEGTASVRQQEGTASVQQQGLGTASVQQQEGTASVRQQEGTASVQQQEGTASVQQQDFEQHDLGEVGFDRWYVGAGGQIVLPQGGSKMRHLGGGAARFGWYATERWAFEGEAAWLEDRCGLAARTVVHFGAWSYYDQFFGFSRFDPFFTAGVQGWMNEGQIGPAFGLGALYYLTDTWALRGDATATLGLDTDVEMVYGLGIGVQYSF